MPDSPMTGRERITSLLSGRQPDRLPFMPITMMRAGQHIGIKYRDYVSDHRVLAEAQVAKEQRTEVDRARLLQVARRNDLVGVDVRLRDGNGHGSHTLEGLHRRAPGQARVRTSVKRPVTAAAAAIAGLMRCVRAPGPWRPTKLRFDVDAQR